MGDATSSASRSSSRANAGNDRGELRKAAKVRALYEQDNTL